MSAADGASRRGRRRLTCARASADRSSWGSLDNAPARGAARSNSRALSVLFAGDDRAFHRASARRRRSVDVRRGRRRRTTAVTCARVVPRDAAASPLSQIGGHLAVAAEVPRPLLGVVHGRWHALFLQVRDRRARASGRQLDPPASFGARAAAEQLQGLRLGAIYLPSPRIAMVGSARRWACSWRRRGELASCKRRRFGTASTRWRASRWRRSRASPVPTSSRTGGRVDHHVGRTVDARDRRGARARMAPGRAERAAETRMNVASHSAVDVVRFALFERGETRSRFSDSMKSAPRLVVGVHQPVPGGRERRDTNTPRLLSHRRDDHRTRRPARRIVTAPRATRVFTGMSGVQSARDGRARRRTASRVASRPRSAGALRVRNNVLVIFRIGGLMLYGPVFAPRVTPHVGIKRDRLSFASVLLLLLAVAVGVAIGLERRRFFSFLRSSPPSCSSAAHRGFVAVAAGLRSGSAGCSWARWGSVAVATGRGRDRRSRRIVVGQPAVAPVVVPAPLAIGGVAAGALGVLHAATTCPIAEPLIRGVLRPSPARNVLSTPAAFPKAGEIDARCPPRFGPPRCRPSRRTA